MDKPRFSISDVFSICGALGLSLAALKLSTPPTFPATEFEHKGRKEPEAVPRSKARSGSGSEESEGNRRRLPLPVASEEPQEEVSPNMEGRRSESRFSINQVLRQAQRSFGKNIAMRSHDGVERSYVEFANRVSRAGTALRTNLGLEEGDKAAILSLNSARYLEYYFICPYAGVWVVPLNIRLAPPEIASVLNECEAKAIFIDDAFAPAVPKLKEAIPSLQVFIYIGDKDVAPEDCMHYEKEVVGGVPTADIQEPANKGGDDVYGCYFTSGTTGKSKGILLSHTNVLMNAYCVMNELGYRDWHRYLHIAPMFHLADGASTFALTMSGGKHVFRPKFTPGEAVDALKSEKISHVLLVPTMVSMMLQTPGLDQKDFSNLKCVLYGASPMPEAVLKQGMKVFGDTGWVQGYGMTELSPVATFLSAKDHRKGGALLRSAGRAVPHCEVMIVDENDTELAPGNVGEIVVKGPSVMLGYFRQEDLTSKVINSDGFLHTGDGGFMDENGYIFVKDRIKDMIVTGGENVYSVEVESTIYELEKVSSCAVIGVPSDQFVEMVAAIVVPKEGQKISEKEVIQHCKEQIAHYKCPKVVIIRNEPLPINAAGKILKSELRKPFWENSGSEIYATDDKKASNYQ